MPRISGTDIPDHKKVKIALTYIFGVGEKTALNVLKQAGVEPEKRARDLKGDEINKIQRVLDKIPTEGDLRQIVNDNIDRLKRIGSYRGERHKNNLPVRGQRTRTNARTKRGKRQTVGAMTKDLSAKMEQAKSAK
jgi:small subunit ribosomal protein S13